MLSISLLIVHEVTDIPHTILKYVKVLKNNTRTLVINIYKKKKIPESYIRHQKWQLQNEFGIGHAFHQTMYKERSTKILK